MALFHCMVRYGSARLGTVRYGTVRLSSGRLAFPLQFSTAIEWAGLFTRVHLFKQKLRPILRWLC